MRAQRRAARPDRRRRALRRARRDGQGGVQRRASWTATPGYYRGTGDRGYRQTHNVLARRVRARAGRGDGAARRRQHRRRRRARRATTLNTGVLGTKYLLPVLTEHGHADVAYALATQTGVPELGLHDRERRHDDVGALGARGALARPLLPRHRRRLVLPARRRHPGVEDDGLPRRSRSRRRSPARWSGRGRRPDAVRPGRRATGAAAAARSSCASTCPSGATATIHVPAANVLRGHRGRRPARRAPTACIDVRDADGTVLVKVGSGRYSFVADERMAPERPRGRAARRAGRVGARARPAARRRQRLLRELDDAARGRAEGARASCGRATSPTRPRRWRGRCARSTRSRTGCAARRSTPAIARWLGEQRWRCAKRSGARSPTTSTCGSARRRTRSPVRPGDAVTVRVGAVNGGARDPARRRARPSPAPIRPGRWTRPTPGSPAASRPRATRPSRRSRSPCRRAQPPGTVAGTARACATSSTRPTSTLVAPFELEVVSPISVESVEAAPAAVAARRDRRGHHHAAQRRARGGHRAGRARRPRRLDDPRADRAGHGPRGRRAARHRHRGDAARRASGGDRSGAARPVHSRRRAAGGGRDDAPGRDRSRPAVAPGYDRDRPRQRRLRAGARA